MWSRPGASEGRQDRKKVSEGFVSDRLDARWADMVWQVNFRDSDFEVYLLLEFQSTIEPYMVVRWLPILGAFYQDQVRRRYPVKSTEGAPTETRASRLPQLPMVIALVVYSGKPIWWPPRDLRELIACPAGVDVSLPVNICYSLLDMGRVPEGRLKQTGDNLVAALVRLERTETPVALSVEWDKLEKWIPPEYHSSYRLWLAAALRRMGFSEFDTLGEDDDREMAMFAENMWEYMQKGIREERAALVLRLTQVKFGSLDAETRHRIESADLSTLLQWAERLLTASTLEELFKNEGGRSLLVAETVG